MTIEFARRRGRIAIYLVSASLAVSALAGWAIHAEWRTETRADLRALTGSPIAPRLAPGADAAASIFIRSGEQGFTLQRTPNGWTIAERGGFPVNGARIDAFLQRLAGLRHGEPKTADPRKLEELGLGDPFLGGSGSLVAVRDVTNALIAEFILGRRGDKLFVRAPDSETGFAVATSSGESAAENLRLSRISDWLDFNVLTLESARLVRVEIAPEGREAYVLEPQKPALTTFPGADGQKTNAPATNGVGAGNSGSDPVPPRFVFAKPWAKLRPLGVVELDHIGQALGRFEPIDVIASGKLTGRALTRRRNVTIDGLVIDAFPLQENGRYWVKLAAQSIDPASAAEAEAINRRVEGWAFGLTAAAWASLAPRLSDIVETKPGLESGLENLVGPRVPDTGSIPTPGPIPGPRTNAAQKPTITSPGPAAAAPPPVAQPESVSTTPAPEAGASPNTPTIPPG